MFYKTNYCNNVMRKTIARKNLQTFTGHETIRRKMFKRFSNAKTKSLREKIC